MSDRRWTVPTLSLLGASALGCEGLIGFDFDAVAPYPADPGTPCGSAQPNGPPEVVGAGGELEILSVIVDTDFGDGKDENGEPDYYSIGYDLDGTCTGRGGAELCTPPAWLDTDTTDGPNGEDNGVGRMFASQDDVFGMGVVTSGFLNEEVAAGRHAPLGILRLRSYNGFFEDDQVEVSWFVPLAPSQITEDAFTPAFDGSDRWPLAEEGLEAENAGGEPVSRYRDAAAYVNAFQLVARFERLLIPIANVYFELRDVVVTAQVSATTARLGLSSGLVAGTVSTDTLLEVIPLTTEAVTGIALCRGAPVYSGIKRFICLSADAPFDRDRGGECDGASAGIRFETQPVRLGDAEPLPLPESACPPGTDSCSDPG